MHTIPFTISKKSYDYLDRITEAIAYLEYRADFPQPFKLQKEDRDRSLYARPTFAEGETIETVVEGTDGKPFEGTSIEIREADNVYNAYGQIMSFDPYSVEDFLRAHTLMMGELINDAGTYRKKNVSIVYGNKLIHRGEKPELVPELIEDLFTRLKRANLHPLFKSGVMHFGIGKIHPFADGNGRMGRLWQSAILCEWNETFRLIPMESVISQRKQQYYASVKRTWKKKDPRYFVQFTYSALYDGILELIELTQQGQKGLD